MRSTRGHDQSDPPASDTAASADPPQPGATRAALPAAQLPQLATLVEQPPTAGDWLCEVKFDGYRLLAFKNGPSVRLVTRNGLDWTHRLKGVASRVAALAPAALLIDCELVTLRPDGVSSFPELQAALSAGRDDTLMLYVFDLLHLDGWDLRSCRLDARKATLRSLAIWTGMIRFSDHIDGGAAEVRRQACSMGLEGVVAKQAAAPYHAGRNRTWVKLKCQNREEFVVVGWTPPSGSRAGLGSLHLGFYDAHGSMHYVGGVGTGFNDRQLQAVRQQLDALAAVSPPSGLLATADKPDNKIRWVRPELVTEVQFAGWSGAGRVRHAVYLGLREDKPASEVVRDIPDPEAPRAPVRKASSTAIVRPRAAAAETPRGPSPPSAKASASPLSPSITLTHPEKELWPGITKQDLADYWEAVGQAALPAVAGRPLALVRCPDGIDGQHFFQKHAMKGQSPLVREASQDGAPYLVFDGASGLRAMTQMAAIELHSWGSPASDAGHADRIVIDLDPGEGVDFPTIARAAVEVRDRLAAAGLTAFCRTSGGKGLHVVTPVLPGPSWDEVRAWCRAFAEAMEAEFPDRYVASVPKARRTGRILIDWLRNGLGSTAVASFSPRARPGAGVATPLAWREVTAKLDPAAFTLLTVPRRLAKLKADPWDGFAAAVSRIPIQPQAVQPSRGQPRKR